MRLKAKQKDETETKGLDYGKIETRLKLDKIGIDRIYL